MAYKVDERKDMTTKDEQFTTALSVITANTSEIEDANCDVLRASIALQLMIYGYDNSNMPDADKIDSFRLIGAFLRDTWNKLTDAQWAIDCALRDIKEGAENGKEQSSTRRGKSPKEDSYPQR